MNEVKLLTTKNRIRKAWQVLTKEICKLYRGKRDMDALAEEIADVTIMLEQLRLIYDINDLVCAHMDAKVLRLQNRVIEKEEV